MSIPLPYGLIAIFIALCLFYYVNQKNRIRKEDQRERMQKKQEEMLNALRKDSKSAGRTSE